MLLMTIALASPTFAELSLPREGLDPLRVKVRWEQEAPDAPRPVIVWSHGAGGSYEGYRPLIEAWVNAGYVVAQPTHDDSFMGLSRSEKAKLIKDPPLHVWKQRPKDVALVLDALPTAAGLPPLDLAHIGMGGHSFGAHTAMLVAGAATPQSTSDDRPEAFLWISPSGMSDKPAAGLFGPKSMEPVTKPVMMITGSQDVAKIRGETAEWRLTTWEAIDAPALLWFVDEGAHNFGGIAGTLVPGMGPADPELVKWVAAATTAFWDQQLRGQIEQPWLDRTSAKAESKGRVTVSHKEAK